MTAIVPIILFTILGGGLVCFIKEKKITGTYSAFGVYNRFSAYITAVCLFAPVIVLISTIVRLIAGDSSFGDLPMPILVSIVLFFIGRRFYRAMESKCPEFLRKKLLISLLISALGISFKLAFFFIGAVWTLESPRTMVDSNGRELLVHGSSVYLPDGTCVGDVIGHDSFKPNHNYPHDNY